MAASSRSSSSTLRIIAIAWPRRISRPSKKLWVHWPAGCETARRSVGAPLARAGLRLQVFTIPEWVFTVPEWVFTMPGTGVQAGAELVLQDGPGHVVKHRVAPQALEEL